MMTQDALRFYKSHSVYDNFGGVVLDREEGKRIAKALGNGKAVILQNHGLLTVGFTNLGSHSGILANVKIGRSIRR
jgi:ribulose-5-phosphate 4-epimerase/fuculose-1-phosphate aldolase